MALLVMMFTVGGVRPLVEWVGNLSMMAFWGPLVLCGAVIEMLLLYAGVGARGRGRAVFMALGGFANITAGAVVGLLLWLGDPVFRLAGPLPWFVLFPTLLLAISALSAVMIRRVGRNVLLSRPLHRGRGVLMTAIMNVASLALFVVVGALYDPLFLYRLV